MAKDNRTFGERYRSLQPTEKTQFMNVVIERCNVGIFAILGWAAGRAVPKKATRVILSDITGAPEEVLFPPRPN